MGLLDDLIQAIEPEEKDSLKEPASAPEVHDTQAEATINQDLPTMATRDRSGERIYSQAFYDKYRR